MSYNAAMQIPDHFTPRQYQIEALNALESGVEMAVLCWARRAGKDLTSFAYAIKKMVQEPMNVALVFPTEEQGSDAFWTNTENDGYRTIDRFPKSLISSMDNNKMRVTLKNGSTFQVLGTKNPDALRGANAKLYIFSEFVDIPVSALKVIRPIVVVNGGQIIMISTPKIDGISGASFKAYFDAAKDHPRRYASLVTAQEYLSEEVLEELRQEDIKQYGSDFMFRQEFLCDWGQVSNASYFGPALTLARQNGKIADHFAHESAYPVYTAWDLGKSDSTAITFFQYHHKKVSIIDYFETNNIGRKTVIDFIHSKPYNYGWHFLPHDGSVRESDLVQVLEKYRQDGLINSSLLRRESKQVGIDRVVTSIPLTTFHEPTTSDLIRKAMLYKRKFNPKTGDYIGPEHTTVSHAADSLRYVYAAIEQFFDKETGELLFSPVSDESAFYESETILTPSQYLPAL